MKHLLSFGFGAAVLSTSLAGAQSPPPPPAVQPSERDVVFGNVANGSLTMDVYRPTNPNGLGIIFISGSGWGSTGYAHDYTDKPLKDDAFSGGAYTRGSPQGLVARGYTVFAINHRFSPEVRFPQPLYDCQRAVRYIRAHASDYGIDSLHIGAIGHSSGAHLASLLGLLDTVIANPRNGRAQMTSSKVQAVVTLAAPFDLRETGNAVARGLTNLLGELPSRGADGRYPLTEAMAAASPLLRVSSKAAPILIYQAQNDTLVLGTNGPAMEKALRDTGVAVQLIMRPTGGHNPAYDLDEIDAWFRRHLRG